MVFTIKYKSSVKKELRKLNQTDRLAIVDKIQMLKIDPKPRGSAKLQGSTNLYLIRHGDYRVIYKFENNELNIMIIKIGHRKEVYKNL